MLMNWRPPWSIGEEFSLKNKVFKTLLVLQAQYMPNSGFLTWIVLFLLQVLCIKVNQCLVTHLSDSRQNCSSLDKSSMGDNLDCSDIPSVLTRSPRVLQGVLWVSWVSPHPAKSGCPDQPGSLHSSRTCRSVMINFKHLPVNQQDLFCFKIKKFIIRKNDGRRKSYL